MKKFSVFMSVVLIFVLACSCTSEKYDTDTTVADDLTNENTEETSTESSTTLDASDPSDTDDDLCIDLVAISASTIEEYEEFVNNTDLPDYFVYYDDLSSLGNFDFFTVLSDGLSGDFTQLYYSFVDKNGFEFSLYVYTNEQYENIRDVFPPIASVEQSYGDFRYADCKHANEKGVAEYEMDGIKYVYVTNRLISIRWENEGTTYIVSSSYLSDYPSSGEDTVISKLLTSQTAVDAVKDVIKRK